MTGRDGVLAGELSIAALHGEFTTALVFEVFPRRVDRVGLGVVHARRLTGVDALVGPVAVRLLEHGPVLRLAHNDDCRGLRGGQFPLDAGPQVDSLELLEGLGTA